MSGAGGASGAGGTEARSPAELGLCRKAPPPGAVEPPPPKPYSGGLCPSLTQGRNVLPSGGKDRQFLLFSPPDVAPGEELPLMFFWHWMGGSADSFRDKGQIEAAVVEQRFIAVLPESAGDSFTNKQFKWPFTVLESDARMEEEFRFFDDMLACVDQQLGVNRHCVSTAGVSAGALFTSQLAHARAEYLASFLSLSGGVGDGKLGLNPTEYVRAWGEPARAVPGVVLWGGPLDWCLINFDVASRKLEASLGGHFFVECIHNCTHGEPPMDVGTGLNKYAPLWNFVFDHPYWLPTGTSPYQELGLPADFPVWCGLRAGSASIREGDCADNGWLGASQCQ